MMPRPTATQLLTILMATAVMACSPAIAKTTNFSKTLTGTWGGTRQSLRDRGITLTAAYTGEFAHNLTGGKRHASAYADQIELGAALDFGKLWGWTGASFHILVTQRGGTAGLEAKAGITAFEQAQEVFGRGRVLRLTSFYYEQKLGSGLVDFRVGRMPMGSAGARFFAGKCYFENLVACGSLTGNVIGSDWFNLPIAQDVGVITINPTPAWYLRIGAVGVNPNNLNTDLHLRFTAPGGWGSTMWVGQLGWHGKLGPHKLPGHFAVGSWHNTRNHPDLFRDRHGLPLGLPAADGGQPMDEPMIDASASGFYVSAQEQVTHNDNGGGLTLFAHFVQADPDTDRLDQLANIGFTYAAPFASRPHDRIQFVIGRTHASSHAIDAIRLANVNATFPQPVPGSAQYTYEVDYVIHVWRGINLMPAYQYITNPGGISAQHNYSVFGMRLAVKL